MQNFDRKMLYIDVTDPSMRLEVDTVVQDKCGLDWSWDHDSGHWGDRPPSLLVWLVNRGGAELRSSAGDFEVSAGDFLVMPSHGYEYHGRHTPQMEFEVTWLFFRVIGNDAPLGGVEGIPLYSKLRDPAFAELLMGRLLVSPSSSQSLWLQALLDEVRRQCVQLGQSELGARIRELGSRIRATPGRYRGLDDMMRDCPCSRDHLIRLFRHHHDVTPVEFLIRARVERARALLSATSFSIKQIAAQLGYADTFCFSRQFKKRTGMSPSAFRRGD
jgi:AraC-like DNA-binding protein